MNVSLTELQTHLILKPEPGPNPKFIFEARFRHESQITESVKILRIIKNRSVRM